MILIVDSNTEQVKHHMCIAHLNIYTYLQVLGASGLLFLDHERVKHTAHYHQWWEVIQLQMLCGVLDQHTSLHV